MVSGQERVAGLAEGDAGASEAAVAGTSEGDADACADVAHDRGEGLLPFVREFLAYHFEEGLGFTAKDAVGGGHEGCKMSTLVQASFEVVPLLA